jgi:cellulose synthase/poly-beta-1,6-N-acetylglucosamine synthase-like glycosyltransferase
MLELWVPLLLIVVWTNRYIFGMLLRFARPRRSPQARRGELPRVTIVVPLFNEGAAIRATLHSLLAQDYPPDRLNIVVVDDASTDDSFHWAIGVSEESPRVTVLRNMVNQGKRKSIIAATRATRAEVIVSVDSDVVVDKRAVRHLVRRFDSPEMAAVGGRVHVLNAEDTWLTRMQAIKYFFGYEYLKGLENAFDSVMCLSGCLTAYRRDVLVELEPILASRNVLGVPIRYGEDRFLTRQIVKAGYRTCLTLDAVCWTRVPKKLSAYFQQQLRWRRSNLIDHLAGMTHAWRLHPLVSLHYVSLFALLVTYPLVVHQALTSGRLFALSLVHGGVLAALGLVYYLATRKRMDAPTVHPIYFLGMILVMPVTYLLLTPAALFTLDSSSWETRAAERARS